MRGTSPATSATERRLDVIKDLLKVLPRGRGFRVAADLSVSVYPASQRAARPPAAKQGRSPRSKRESRSEQGQGSKRAATNARTRRSAVRAAKHHAERREQAEIRLWQLACKMAKALPAAPAPAPAAPPPPAPSSPDVRMRSPSGSAEKRMHTPDSRASQTPATPPERAQDEKAQAGGRRRSPRRRRHTAGPRRQLRSRPRPTRSLIAQPYPTAPSTHLAAVRLLARPTHAYRPWAGNKHPRLGTRVPATPGLVSTQPIAGVGDIWPGSSRLSVFQARLC